MLRKGWEMVLEWATDPKALAMILGILLLGYVFWDKRKRPVPKIFDVWKILTEYWAVFTRKSDFFWMIAIITVLAQMENAAMAGNTDNSFSQIGVILSLLVAAIIGIMPMALSKGESLEQQSTHDASYPQKKAYIRDIMRIGMFEILISFGDLILIFGLSGLDAANKWMPWGTFAVYWLFWLFSVNILMVMHKLYLLYLGEEKK